MEATAAERYASGGPERDLYAQNLVRGVRGDRRAASATTRRSSPAQGDDEVTITWSELRDRVGADRRRPREPRRRQGRHGRDDAQQPPRVHPHRPRGGLARRGPVLDLPDLLAGADPVRRLRRRREGRDHRDGVPRGLRQGARGPAGRRDAGRRSTATAATTRSTSSRRSTRTSTPAETVAGGRARRPADADLHLGHDRAAEGRPAHPPQPDDADRRASTTSSTSPSAARR